MLKWKIVFWLSALLLMVNLINLPFQESISAYEILGLICGSFAVIMIYGYANNIAIGSKNIAIAIFIINLCLSLFSAVELIYMLSTDFEPILLLVLVIVIPFMLLFTIPQYRYAFKSENVWRVAV
jgi:hypothetical protein